MQTRKIVYNPSGVDLRSKSGVKILIVHKHSKADQAFPLELPKSSQLIQLNYLN
jgi:hypothetical protein